MHRTLDFSGEPCRNVPGIDGFTPYSLGQNQTDEGGEMTRNNREGDLTWRGRRPEGESIVSQ